MVDVARSGRRLLVIFGQRDRAIAPCLGLVLGPVVDLDGRELGAGRIEREQAIAVDSSPAMPKMSETFWVRIV